MCYAIEIAFCLTLPAFVEKVIQKLFGFFYSDLPISNFANFHNLIAYYLTEKRNVKQLHNE